MLSGPQTGRSVTLGRGSHTIGRDPGCDVVLADPYLSKRHLRIDIGQTVEVVDLGSANGIEIDGELVSRARVPGTLVVLAGGTELLIEVETHEARRGRSTTSVPSSSTGRRASRSATPAARSRCRRCRASRRTSRSRCSR